MDRIDKLLENPEFQMHLAKNIAAEADRCFCRHGMEHFLDVARIAWIINLEETLGLEKEIIYAAAFAHDLGRHLQYSQGIPHEEAGAVIAAQILPMAGFESFEVERICRAIKGHRGKQNAPDTREDALAQVLYRADKACRPCFSCKAEKDCNWSAEKKNLRIKY